jgi:predicted nucleic acid-binding protein
VSFAVDNNILLRSIDHGHPAQPVAENALSHLRDRGETAFIFPQNLIEFWAVAPRPIANNGLGWTTERTQREIADLKKLFVVLAYSEAILPAWEGVVLRHNVIGKQAHDAHLVAAMVVNGLTRPLTFNEGDFKRFTEISVINPRSFT